MQWHTYEEKERINNILKNNEDKYQAELREKYNPDNLFKKQKSEILNLENNTITEETAIIEYKEKNFLKKIFDKIKHLFKKNQKIRNEQLKLIPYFQFNLLHQFF